MCSTVFCGVLDPGTGRLIYSSAGHPPGILASPDSGVSLLEDGRSLSLAVKSDVCRSDAECLMPGRATLLLYTDGLAERRRRALDAGIAIAGQPVEASRSARPDAGRGVLVAAGEACANAVEHARQATASR